MAGFDSYNTDYRNLYEAFGLSQPDPGGITPGGMIDAQNVYGKGGSGVNRSITGDGGLTTNIRKTVRVDAYGRPVYASTFPARPEVPFQNNTRLAGRLPSIVPDVPGATGVAANDWYSQPGNYVNQLGAVQVSDLPALPGKPSSIFDTQIPFDPNNPMTIAANQAAAEFVANSGDMNGRAKANAPLGVYGGNNNVQATRKPGYQRGDGLLAFMTQNDKQPIKGIGGLIERLLTPTQRMDVATKMDVPSPAQRYDNANAVARLNAYFAPRTGSAGGYEYRNGQKVGYAPVATPFGSATPTSGAQAYSLSNAASKLNAIANSAEPSKNLARASLAAQWGFD